jgi:hypothetical protein
VAIIDAIDDSYSVSAQGGTTASVLGNDTVGATAATGSVTLTPGTVATPPLFGSVTMNADGTITVAAGTTPGMYTVSYQICAVGTPTACDTATATVTVPAEQVVDVPTLSQWGLALLSGVLLLTGAGLRRRVR